MVMLNGTSVSWFSSVASIGHSRSQPCLAGVKIYAEAQEEYSLIKKAHRTLAPTGCTPEFCQAGRMARIYEPRMGRDRPLAEIQQEAIDFLRECRDEEVIVSDQILEQRIKEALVQITTTSEEKMVTDEEGKQFQGIAGGFWEQTHEELEYGLRAAWKNSRRCIMRSEHMHLALYDLRHVTTSREMVHSILDGMVKAFNRGRILPACFVFPPRLPGRRGPMVWNAQILQFAGYQQPDGSVLGDPASVELTQAFIEFGWTPPRKPTRWDILPLIAMAEGDRPYMAEIPPELRRTVSISHPRFETEFKEMDLHWVMAPALSRLGFDIGGNQYTSSPFIGWFMDAEIGVRNLADNFRYNVLPEVARHCKLIDEPETSLDNLPEYLTLVALSRAQAELNFAVYYSFLRAHVTMTDTMTSSIKYQNYDLDRQDALGYRLPADPYWLAPQGSIIPLWHQGGLPNYQPKPMICRHVQDPIRAWKRELEKERRGDAMVARHSLRGSIDESGRAPKVGICLCSSGVNAGKMARKPHNSLEQVIADSHEIFELQSERALNALSLSKSSSEDVILIVASTTGSGDIPGNAAKFVKEYNIARPLEKGPRFSIFANGDSTYGDTYNAAANKIQETMVLMGCRPLLDQSFAGDTALNNPDWESFNQWSDNIENLFSNKNSPKVVFSTVLDKIGNKPTALRVMPFATLIRKYRPHENGMVQVTFDIGNLEYREMDHLKLLTPNPQERVRQILKSFGLDEDALLTWHSENAFCFLCHFVDLSRPFKTLNWYPVLDDLTDEVKEQLRRSAVCDFLNRIEISWTDKLIEGACKDMGSIQPRLYSVASCQRLSTDGLNGINVEELNSNLVDVVVKINDSGKFSNNWLLQAPNGAKIRFGQASPDTWRLVRAQRPDAPFIAIATGSGIGPVRSVLQSRMKDLKWTSGLDETSWRDEEAWNFSSKPNSRKSSIGSNMAMRATPKLVNHHAHLGISNTSGTVHLFVGFKNEDELLIDHLIRPAFKAGILGTLEMVPSNPDKVRIQDRLIANKEKLAKLFEDPSLIVFVCANENAAEAAEKRLDEIVGSSVRERLGERYIEEVFRSHSDGSS